MGNGGVLRRWSSGIVLALSFAHTTPAAAQATRTWVSGLGNDADVCSRTAPCKTFAGAVSRTDDGGEINAIDPGGYGAVTITKNLTIDGGGTFASILAEGTNGVIVNLDPGERVTLRNLVINGAADGDTPGLNGIRFLGAGDLHVEHCVIQHFSAVGISVEGSGNLFVDDTTILNVDGAAIRTTSPASSRVTIEGSRMQEVGFGVRASGGQVVVVNDTSVADSAGPGFWAEGATEMHLKDALVAHSAVGVQASGGAIVNAAGLTAVGNAGGAFLAEGGGQIVPFSGQLITANPPGGASTCELAGAADPVACLAAGGGSCPTPVCPEPSCPAPVIQSSLGTCKKCKTRGGKTICTGCVVDIE